jgi:hypothetical protein
VIIHPSRTEFKEKAKFEISKLSRSKVTSFVITTINTELYSQRYPVIE